MELRIGTGNLFSNRIRIVCRVLLVVSLFAAGISAVGQDKDRLVEPVERPNQEPSIHVDADLVLIPVTVVARDDRPFPGLSRDHFRLYEDRVEQVITHFAKEDAPVSIAFLLDTSASMADKLRKSREAISNLLNNANPEDEFLLVEFNEQADMVLGICKDTGEVRRQLDMTHARGRTALLDAIYISLREVRKAHNTRKALVIVSDGGDNSSRRTLSEIKDLVRESDVQIYALGVVGSRDVRFQSQEEMAGPALLRAVAKQSGGLFFEVHDVGELPEIAEKISDALRTRYVLGYSPANSRRDGKYHQVEVKLVRSRGIPKLQAFWRRGYVAPTE